MPDFTCNICGRRTSWNGAKLDRENASCSACGSNLRTRGLIHALSLELFGMSLALPEFPRVRSLRGLGLSDPAAYAEGLASRFDYRNTFFDRAPRLDITQPPAGEKGVYDFITASEIFEHTAPPARRAFDAVARLLNERGVLVMTVPYEIHEPHTEHFPSLHEYGLTRLGEKTVLVNRNADGRTEVFENLGFHQAFGEPSLEMRAFSEQGLREALAGAGFSEVRVHAEDYPAFGIAHAESWSLPITGRKTPFGLTREAAAEIVEQWREAHRRRELERQELERSVWFRAGRRLGLL